MSYTHKPNSGTLFDNDRKIKDSHPNFKGSALIDGKEYWLSAWNNESEKGNRISIAFELKQNVLSSQTITTSEDKNLIPKDDDIPF